MWHSLLDPGDTKALALFSGHTLFKDSEDEGTNYLDVNPVTLRH